MYEVLGVSIVDNQKRVLAIFLNKSNDKVVYGGNLTECFTMVGDVKDWQIIFKGDMKKAIKLQKEYEELVQKFRSLNKHQISDEKRKQIDVLLDDIKVKLEKVKRIDCKQELLLKNYYMYIPVNSWT